MIFILAITCIILLFSLREMKKIKFQIAVLKYEVRHLKAYRKQMSKSLDALVDWVDKDTALSNRIIDLRDSKTLLQLDSIERDLRSPTASLRKKS